VEIKGKSIAVIGASNNPEKYGNKVITAIKRITNEIFPINPKETQILGLKSYSEFGEIKDVVDIAVFVVPPKVTLEVIKKINDKKLFYWFQPGSFDKEVTDYCKKNGLNFEKEKCIIEESNKIS
jgi:predicted CoA-binding protein